jgi:hypothetical protein
LPIAAALNVTFVPGSTLRFAGCRVKATGVRITSEASALATAPALLKT